MSGKPEEPGTQQLVSNPLDPVEYPPLGANPTAGTTNDGKKGSQPPVQSAGPEAEESAAVTAPPPDPAPAPVSQETNVHIDVVSSTKDAKPKPKQATKSRGNLLTPRGGKESSTLDKLREKRDASIVPAALSPSKVSEDAKVKNSVVGQTALERLRQRRNQVKEDEIVMWDLESLNVDSEIKTFARRYVQTNFGTGVKFAKAAWTTSAYSQSFMKLVTAFNNGSDALLSHLIDREEETRTETTKTRNSLDFIAGYLLADSYNYQLLEDDMELFPPRYRDGMRHAYACVAFEFRCVQYPDLDRSTLAKILFPGESERKALFGKHFASANPGVTPKEAQAAGTLIRMSVDKRTSRKAAESSKTRDKDEIITLHKGMQSLGSYNNKVLATQFLPTFTEFRDERGAIITHRLYKEGKKNGRVVSEGKRAVFPEIKVPNKVKAFCTRTDIEVIKRFNRNSRDLTLQVLRETLRNTYAYESGVAEFKAPFTFADWWGTLIAEGINKPIERLVDSAIRSSGAYDPQFTYNQKGKGRGKGGAARQVVTRSDGKSPSDMIHNALADLITTCTGPYSTLVQAKLGEFFSVSAEQIVVDPTCIVLDNANFKELCNTTHGVEGIAGLKALRLQQRDQPEAGILHDGFADMSFRNEGGNLYAEYGYEKGYGKDQFFRSKGYGKGKPSQRYSDSGSSYHDSEGQNRGEEASPSNWEERDYQTGNEWDTTQFPGDANIPTMQRY